MVPPVNQTRSVKGAPVMLLPRDYITLEQVRKDKERYFIVADDDLDRSARRFYPDSELMQELRSQQFMNDE